MNTTRFPHWLQRITTLVDSALLDARISGQVFSTLGEYDEARGVAQASAAEVYGALAEAQESTRPMVEQRASVTPADPLDQPIGDLLVTSSGPGKTRWMHRFVAGSTVRDVSKLLGALHRRVEVAEAQETVLRRQVEVMTVTIQGLRTVAAEKALKALADPLDRPIGAFMRIGTSFASSSLTTVRQLSDYARALQARADELDRACRDVLRMVEDRPHTNMAGSVSQRLRAADAATPAP